jgi:phage shock protein A
MGIFDRVGKVISSNVNSLLDRAEDPHKSVGLLVEEMREQIRRGRQEVVSAVAAEKQLRKKVADLDQQVDKWQRRAELAVKANDETLAREALLFKKRLVEERDRAEALRAEQRRQALQLKDDMERATKKLKELEARKGTIATRYQQAKAGGGAEALGAEPGQDTPFERFRRMEDKLERKDAEAEAMQEAQAVLKTDHTDGMTADDLEAKFAELEDEAGTGASSKNDEDDVEAELKALRKKFRVAT